MGDPANIKHRILGIKPTKEDRAYVSALSLMGMSLRDISEKLGERFKLEAPMSRMSLYYHFKTELGERKLGRKPKQRGGLRKKVMATLEDEVEAMIRDISGRANRRNSLAVSTPQGGKRKCLRCGAVYVRIRCPECARKKREEKKNAAATKE